MKQISRLGLWVIIGLLVVALTASSGWAQGKGGGKGGGGGGGSDPPPDPPPPEMPEVRYHVEHLQPPPGMEAMWVLNMARGSRELIAEATNEDDPTIDPGRLFCTPYLRLDNGTWVRLFPPAEAEPVDDNAWRVRAISDSGRFVLFFHQLDPDALRVECDFWVLDRLENKYFHALYWPGTHNNVGYAINDEGEFLFRGFIGSTLHTLFVSNAYLDGQPVEIGSGDFAINESSNNRTLNNNRQYAHRTFEGLGARFQILEIAGVFDFVFDRYVPPFWSGNKNNPGRSQARDINNFGDITGSSSVNKDYQQACVHYDDGELVNIHPPAAGNNASVGRGINDQAWVIGTANSLESWFLHVPGYTSVPLRDLLIEGDLVAYDASQMTWLDTRPWRPQIANDGTILHQRWKVGDGTNNIMSHAVPFLLSPLPLDE